MVEEYETIQNIYNICPTCGKREIWRIRFKTKDEGHGICLACRNNVEKDDCLCDCTTTKELIQELFERLENGNYPYEKDAYDRLAFLIGTENQEHNSDVSKP